MTRGVSLHGVRSDSPSHSLCDTQTVGLVGAIIDLGLRTATVTVDEVLHGRSETRYRDGRSEREREDDRLKAAVMRLGSSRFVRPLMVYMKQGRNLPLSNFEMIFPPKEKNREFEWDAYYAVALATKKLLLFNGKGREVGTVADSRYTRVSAMYGNTATGDVYDVTSPDNLQGENTRAQWTAVLQKFLTESEAQSKGITGTVGVIRTRMNTVRESESGRKKRSDTDKLGLLKIKPQRAVLWTVDNKCRLALPLDSSSGDLELRDLPQGVERVVALNKSGMKQVEVEKTIGSVKQADLEYQVFVARAAAEVTASKNDLLEGAAAFLDTADPRTVPDSFWNFMIPAANAEAQVVAAKSLESIEELSNAYWRRRTAN